MKESADKIYDRDIHGPLHDPKSASAYLRDTHSISRSESRLANLRVAGLGPEFLKQGRAVFYPQQCLDAWARIINGKPISRHTSFKETIMAADAA
jgi:hypothetical protein